MSRPINMLLAVAEKIIDCPKMILSEMFMMTIFTELMEELPPLRDYWVLLFNDRKITVYNKNTASKVCHLWQLRKELFEPQRQTNKDSDELVVEFAVPVFEAFLDELRNGKKATYKYLNESGSKYSWDNCPPRDHEQTKGCVATDDLAESALGGVTGGIEKAKSISKNSAAGVADAQRDHVFDRRERKVKAGNGEFVTKSRGMFHTFKDGIAECVVRVGIEDAASTTQDNGAKLKELQERKVAVMKELEDLQIAKAGELLCVALFGLPLTWLLLGKKLEKAQMYHGMYSSQRRLTTKKGINQAMKNLDSETARIRALHEQLQMRVHVGLPQFDHPKSKGGVPFGSKVLLKHLKDNLHLEKEFQPVAVPKCEAPTRKALPILGTMTHEGHQLDAKRAKIEGRVREIVGPLKIERQSRKGQKSAYSLFQPYDVKIAKLKGERIDVRCKVSEDDDGFQWCQGEVIEVMQMGERPVVNVKWDATPDLEGYEGETMSEQVLLPNNFNREVNNGWRLDLAIEIEKPPEK